jgi:hypothetical protein
MWLLGQCSSQRCNVYTYILALVESSSQHLFMKNRHRPLCPKLLLFQVHNYLPLAHNLHTRSYPDRMWCLKSNTFPDTVGSDISTI